MLNKIKLSKQNGDHSKKTFSGKRPGLFRVYILSTLNNTILTLTDEEGKVKAWKSAGSAGFKGARRATSYAAQQAGELLAHKLRSLHFDSTSTKTNVQKKPQNDKQLNTYKKQYMVTVHLKGFGPGRDASVKGLKIGGLKIQKIEDRTSIPHNGCRPPKKRRF